MSEVGGKCCSQGGLFLVGGTPVIIFSADDVVDVGVASDSLGNKVT